MTQGRGRNRLRTVAATLLTLAAAGGTLASLAAPAVAESCTGHEVGGNCYGVRLPRQGEDGCVDADCHVMARWVPVVEGTCVGLYVDDHCTGVQV